MNDFLNTKAKKIIFIILVVTIIELSGHGILVSLLRLFNS
tara:strand:+ start:458 stop:577 length:120 start_codon:yes stop_codon:yes gene_type:complete